MAQFTFSALDGSGKTIEGTLDVVSKSEVYRQLEDRSLTPIQVSHAGEGRAASQQADGEDSQPPKLKRAQLILFTEELSDLLDAGLQLQQALGILHERQDVAAIRSVSGRLRAQIDEGASFSNALKAASPSFDDLYCNLVAAGEVSGSLPEILRRLARSLTVLHELQSRVLQAMVYPAFMIVACIILMIVFMTVLVPQLTNLLSSTSQKLPLATRILVQLSDTFITYWWVLLAVAGVSFLIFRSVVAREEGRRWWDEIKLKFPLFGPVIATRYYAGFSHALGNLVSNGVPLLAGLKLMTRATPNKFFQHLLKQVEVAVGEGESLSSSLRQTKKFPLLLADMVAIGEQTGKLGRALEKAGRRYDKELDVRIKRLTSLISPVIIIIMAIMVTAVAYSIVTAIFQSVRGIRGRG